MNQQHQHDMSSAGVDVPTQRGAAPQATPRARVALRVMLVDDTPDILSLMRMLFECHDGFEICATGSNGLEALELWREHRPDVVVMDVRMPVMSGLESAAQMLAEDPAQRVVLFSASFRAVDHGIADAIGVSSCLDKRDLERLPELVERVAGRVRPRPVGRG